MAIFAGSWTDEAGAPFDGGAAASSIPEAPNKAAKKTLPYNFWRRRTDWGYTVGFLAYAWHNWLLPEHRESWMGDAVYGVRRRDDTEYTPKEITGRYCPFILRNFFRAWHAHILDLESTATPTAAPIIHNVHYYLPATNTVVFYMEFEQPIWTTAGHSMAYWTMPPKRRGTKSARWYATPHVLFNAWEEDVLIYHPEIPLLQTYPPGTILPIWARWCQNAQVHNWGNYEVTIP